MCAPLPGEMGLGGYYGHYQGHWLSATSFLINATGNATIKRAADAAIDTLESVMRAWREKYGAKHDGCTFPYDPVVWEKLLAGHGAHPYYSVPFYTLHKLWRGCSTSTSLPAPPRRIRWCYAWRHGCVGT